MRSLVAYVATTVAFVAIDLVWLGVIATRFYREQLGTLLLDKPNMAPAGLFYLIIGAGTVVFAVMPALEAGSMTRALLLGAFFGFCAYATYDLTNLAVMRGFPAVLAAVDLAWGTVLTAGAALAGYFAARAF